MSITYKVQAYEISTDSVNQSHIEKALADIQSVCKVDRAHCQRILEESSIDHPVALPTKNVEYWIEYD